MTYLNCFELATKACGTSWYFRFRVCDFGQQKIYPRTTDFVVPPTTLLLLAEIIWRKLIEIPTYNLFQDKLRRVFLWFFSWQAEKAAIQFFYFGLRVWPIMILLNWLLKRPITFHDFTHSDVFLFLYERKKLWRNDPVGGATPRSNTFLPGSCWISWRRSLLNFHWSWMWYRLGGRKRFIVALLVFFVLK